MGIDTSSKIGSVAVIEKKRIIDEILSEKARSFSRSLLGMIEAILARNSLNLTDLSAIACAIGPGSFTGIRIGLSTVQGIAISTGTPVYGISTLEAMAAVARKDATALCPVIDAGKAGVYYASFENSDENSERLHEDAFGTIEDAVGKSPENAVFFGDVSPDDRESLAGMSRTFDDGCMENSSAAGAALAAARRIAIGKDGGGGRLEHLRPNYIRKSYAEK